MRTYEVNMFGLDLNKIGLTKEEINMCYEVMPFVKNKVINFKNIGYKFYLETFYHGNNCGDFISGGLGFEIPGGIKGVIDFYKNESFFKIKWLQNISPIIAELENDIKILKSITPSDLDPKKPDLPSGNEYLSVELSTLEKLLNYIRNNKMSPEYYTYEVSD